MRVYTMKTFDGIREEKSIIFADFNGRDTVRFLEDEFGNDFKYETHDVEDLIEIETTSGGFATLKYYNLNEIKEVINDIYGDYTAESISDYPIEISPEFKEYDGVEIVQDYIDDIKNILCQL